MQSENKKYYRKHGIKGNEEFIWVNAADGNQNEVIEDIAGRSTKKAFGIRISEHPDSRITRTLKKYFL